MNDSVDLEKFKCPIPLADHAHIVMGHGGGGRLTAELIERIFLPAFGTTGLPLLDSTVLTLPGHRIAVSTDSYVVNPLFFPGGSIGDLAVHGTLNDLAMSGAKPIYLTAGFVLEEGLPLQDLVRIVQDMAAAAQAAGVSVIAGDTKVVERGHGDGCYINTTGIGLIQSDLQLTPQRVLPGDAILLSGNIGDHALAIMSMREGLAFDSPIRSDTAYVGDLVRLLLESCPDIRALRDPTRGGLAAALNEIAQAGKCGIEIRQTAIPVDPVVASACELLGLDPMQAANEGKFLMVLPSEQAEIALAVMHAHPLGREARSIGRITDDPHRLVVSKTPYGAERLIPMPLGIQLPRIC